jgi:hypothetical protein
VEKAWDRWDQAAGWAAWNVADRGVVWVVVKGSSAVGDRTNCVTIAIGTFNGDDEAQTSIRELTSARIESIIVFLNT